MTASDTEVLIYESDRHFELWNWSVSHSDLILRSNRTSDLSTRVEILFKNVRAAGIASSFRNLRVHAIVEGPEVLAAESVLGRSLHLLPHTDEVLFRLIGGPGRAWILASVVAGREDGNSYDAPTMFDGRSARADVSEMFPTFPHPTRS
jgi:hypothetical protein